ncbi:MAG: DUF3656 domain-containing protein [Collinsella sp.]|nr:DUF3656 domain-containing protein [Collinsella sp.]
MSQVASPAHAGSLARRRAARPELLAPAGGPAPFAAALAAGADAIYCGMGSFNARRKADNFDDASFAAACRAAHLAGTRVYVTVNIVIKDDEMEGALELVRRCATLGADAFIIQDWGLFQRIRDLMPQLETHVSTQANIHDVRGALWCRDRGADRVTLSRELSVDEIALISKTGIELEVFAHGAICFCYSGVCLLSSFARAGRSANRGMCAQPCRLPYELIDESGRSIAPAERARPLCPRDTNTSEMLPALIDAGAGALKLEGRMKAPDYVFSVVDAYRRQLDDVLAHRIPDEDERQARARQLKRCFNRDFTTEYQLGRSGDEMMSYERSNNRGQIVGEVLGSKPAGGNLRGLPADDRRRRAALARIRLHEPVGAGDLLELRHDDEFDRFLTTLAPADAAAGEVIECRVPRAMPAGSRVRIIRSQSAIDTADAALKRDVPRRRPVDVRIIARKGAPFSVTLTCIDDPALSATATGFTVEVARTRPVISDDLIEHVGRMGGSPFTAASFHVELDEGCGMGFSAVHKVRAAACSALEEAILAPYAAMSDELEGLDVSAHVPDPPSRRPDGVDHIEICALVTSLDHVRRAREAGADTIYADVDALIDAGISPADATREGIVPVLDEVCRETDRDRLDPWVVPSARVAVGNISELALAAELGAHAEIRTCLPVHNRACAQMLAGLGAHAFWLSPELSLPEIERLGADSPAPLGIVAFGRPRVMTSEHCILQVANACIHDCGNCRLRRRRLWLRNIDGRELPVTTDIHGRSRLYDSSVIDLAPQIPQLISAGVTRFMVDGTLMDADELDRAVSHISEAIRAAATGRRGVKRLPDTTSGCLFVGVD